MRSFYRGKKVFVSGGAGFIGHHLLRALLREGAHVTVGDNLTSGSLSNILNVWRERRLQYTKVSQGYRAQDGSSFVRVDLQDLSSCRRVLTDHEILFHLAANIGGRGYIQTHPADCCEGFAINQNMVKAAYETGVARIVFASSACVYPVALQNKYGSRHKLKEQDAVKDGWVNADEEYGWAKFAGETILSAYCRQYGVKGVSVRYVTAYGPGENDTHAIPMLIRRAIERRDPYMVWGSGNQDRDFTYIDDIVSGTLAACQHVTDGSSVNIGTGTRYTIKQVISHIFDILDWHPERIVYDRSKPEGVRTRALHIGKAQKVMQWMPQYDLREGLAHTIEWFKRTKPQSVETLR